MVKIKKVTKGFSVYLTVVEAEIITAILEGIWPDSDVPYKEVHGITEKINKKLWTFDREQTMKDKVCEEER